MLDSELKVASANRAFQSLFGLSPAQAVGKRVSELAGPWQDAELERWLREHTTDGKTSAPYSLDGRFPNVGHKRLVLNAHQLQHGGGLERLIVVVDGAGSET